MDKKIQLKKSVEQPMLQKQSFRSPPHNNHLFEGRQQYQQQSFPQQQSHQQPLPQPHVHQHSHNQQQAPHQYQQAPPQQPTPSFSSSSIANVLSTNNNPTLQKALNHLLTTDATILKNIVENTNGDKINSNAKPSNNNFKQMNSGNNVEQSYAKNTSEEKYNGGSGHIYDDLNQQPRYNAGVYDQYSNSYNQDQEKYNDYYKNYVTH